MALTDEMMGRICVRLRKRLTNYFIVVRTDPLSLIGINILLIVNREIAENAVLGLCSSCLPLMHYYNIFDI
jgi:hypothetical protein